MGRGGGHLALLAALTGAAACGVVAWFPVTDLARLPDDVTDACGVPDRGPGSREALLLGAPAPEVPELARQASPVAYASAAAPPVLLMHGAADDMVPRPRASGSPGRFARPEQWSNWSSCRARRTSGTARAT